MGGDQRGVLQAPFNLYVIGVASTIGAVLAAEPVLPIWTVVLLAVFTPIAPAFVVHALTNRKLSREADKNRTRYDEQARQTHEIHVMVNSQLTSTVAALHNTLSAFQALLVENITLKDRLGEPVPDDVREVSEITDVGVLADLVELADTSAAGPPDPDPPKTDP